jgi:hypothetical protein
MNMKITKVIGGKKYDTETATQLAFHQEPYPTDFKFKLMREALYRTAKGAYFLAGKGGGLSKYAKSDGDKRSEGSGIIPLTEAEALTWCEKTGNHEAACAHLKVEEA